MGLLVSPEGLTVLGNSAGRAGYGLTYFVMSAALIHILTAIAYGRIFTQYRGPFGEVRLIRKAFGAIPAVLVPACGRVTVAVCASTALLATAGYVFNEVFLYWFPNLGFSFCLLGVLLLLNLFGTRVAAAGQLVFVGLVLGGLLFLSVTGFFGWGNPPPPTQDGPSPLAHLPQIAVASLLLFVGFDLAGFAGEDRGNPAKAMMAAILLAGLVFSCWGWVSAKYVPLGRLADTSIPHVKAARAVLGETGRIWMGVIILAGSSAAVNAILIAVSRMMTIMATEGLLPPFLAMGKNRATMGMFIIVAAVAAMMGSGMAGESILEVYIRAGICFWLFHYAVIHGALLVMAVRALPGSPMQTPRGRQIFPIAGLTAMALTLTGILIMETEWRLLLRTVVILFAFGFAFAAFWVPLSRKKGWLNTP
jgi:amino acid transporter